MARTTDTFLQIIRNLASWFRLGQSGAAVAGTQQPARPRLETPAAIVSELRSMQTLPTPAEGAREIWNYVCYWVNTDTGERVGRGVRWEVPMPAGSSYQAASAQARRWTMEGMTRPGCPVYPREGPMRLRCQRRGNPYTIPTS
jgi:hypothetical protein